MGLGKTSFTQLLGPASNQPQVGQFTFWSTLGVRTNHGLLWTHKIHHSLDLGEATTFPHIVFSTLFHHTYIRMALFPETPKEESRNYPEIVPVWIPETLAAHNSFLEPPIGMRSKANLQLSLRAFQRCVALRLHTPASDQFPNFSGRESNCQFDSRPFFCT